MLLFFWTLIIFLILIILVLSFRWKISVSGKFLYDKNVFSYSVHALVGGRKRGVGINKTSDCFIIFLGQAHSPFFTIPLGRKKKTEAKQNTRKKNKRTPNIFRLLSAVKHSIHWKYFELKGEFGLQDPSQTGKVFGVLMAVANGLFPHKFQHDIQPNFDRKMVDINCDTTVQFRPTTLAWRIGQAYININY